MRTRYGESDTQFSSISLVEEMGSLTIMSGQVQDFAPLLRPTLITMGSTSVAYEPASKLRDAMAEAAHWTAFMAAENERKDESEGNQSYSNPTSGIQPREWKRNDIELIA
jgi:hypothetical protein